LNRRPCRVDHTPSGGTNTPVEWIAHPVEELPSL